MEVRATESALYEEIGRLTIANKALMQRIAIVNKENARLRADCDKLAGMIPEETEQPAGQ